MRFHITRILKKPDFKPLLLNFANYSLYQIICYLVPLITIPYIVRIIGAEKFGIISIAQAFVYYLNIITDYGFKISGVQYIAQNQNDRIKCSEILLNILLIQISLMLLNFVFLLIIIHLFDYLYTYRYIFLFSFLIIPGNIFTALWFYLGFEKVKFINYISIIARLLYITFILTFLQRMDDYYLVPLLNSLSFCLAGIYSLILIFIKFKIRFSFSVSLQLKSYLKKGYSINISQIFMNLYRNSNILILSLVASEASVGIYSAGEKIIKAIQGTFSPITQVLYPYISRITLASKEKSLKIIKMLTLIMAVISGFISGIIFIFSRQLVDIAFGKSFADTHIIIRIACFVILFGVINYIVGIIFMTNNHLKTEFSKSVLMTGILNVIFCIVLSYYFTGIGAAIAFLLSEIVLLLIMLYYIYMNKNNWTYDVGK